jgi:hypothetical protein
MKKLHTFHLWERPQAGLFKDLLAKEGIECLLRNEQLSAALGEIPFTECYPELWVVDEEIYPRARQLLDAWLKVADPPVADWVCAGCGETLPGNFAACWACGRDCDLSTE